MKKYCHFNLLILYYPFLQQKHFNLLPPLFSKKNLLPSSLSSPLPKTQTSPWKNLHFTRSWWISLPNSYLIHFLSLSSYFSIYIFLLMFAFDSNNLFQFCRHFLEASRRSTLRSCHALRSWETLPVLRGKLKWRNRKTKEKKIATSSLKAGANSFKKWCLRGLNSSSSRTLATPLSTSPSTPPMPPRRPPTEKAQDYCKNRVWDCLPFSPFSFLFFSSLGFASFVFVMCGAWCLLLIHPLLWDWMWESSEESCNFYKNIIFLQSNVYLFNL